jgi:PPM family protein phosphatase
MGVEIRIRAAAASDVGRVRRSNEDAFGFDLERGLFIVCDGVGGARAGEVASASAVDCILSRFPQDLDGNDAGSELQRAIQAANRSIWLASRRDPLYDGMCTTIVAAHFDGSRMWVGHVGDSRAYLLRNQSLHRLTDDHSQLAQRLQEGQRHFTDLEMERLSSILTQAIGATDFVVPTITTVQVQLGDCFLLATDGVCKVLPNADMLALLRTAATPEQACQLLVTAASDAGGSDNATCVVVEID